MKGGTSHRITIATPPGFDFWRTAFSHGWCALLPFSHDPATRTLQRALTLGDNRVARCKMHSENSSLIVEATSVGGISPDQMERIEVQLRSALRLDEDFSTFHGVARKHPGYRWIAKSGAGRLLRAPSVFEDVVKMICTTNCTWSLTTLMVTNLVLSMGPNGEDSDFPSPAVLAGSSEKFLRTDIKAGYRSPYLLEFAERVAAGKLDVESWRTSPFSTEELYKNMRSVKGIGPYAAGNLLKLMGRYDYLGLDSWVRGQYYRLHTQGRRVKDKTIERRYKSLGPWRGLFFWLEMTRDWHDDKFTF